MNPGITQKVIMLTVLTLSLSKSYGQNLNFNFNDLQQKLEVGIEAKAQAAVIQKHIDSLTEAKNQFINTEYLSKRFTAHEIAGLLQNSKNSLPTECKVEVKVTDNLIETTLANSKIGKSINTTVNEVSIDTAENNSTQIKLWSYSANLIFSLNKSTGALESLTVRGSDGWLSCPE